MIPMSAMMVICTKSEPRMRGDDPANEDIVKVARS